MVILRSAYYCFFIAPGFLILAKLYVFNADKYDKLRLNLKSIRPKEKRLPFLVSSDPRVGIFIVLFFCCKMMSNIAAKTKVILL